MDQINKFGITSTLIEHIKHHEGFRSTSYLCPAGYPTIGYGHRLNNEQIECITKEEAEQQLIQDLILRRDNILKISPNLASHEYKLSAVLDFVFNVGFGAYQKSTMKRRIDEENWEEAADEMLRWVYGGSPKRILKGLLLRRSATAEWLKM